MLDAVAMTNPDDIRQLAPTGKLRGGVVAAPAASALFAIREGKGEVRGVTVDLLRLYGGLKLPLAIQIYDNLGRSPTCGGERRLRCCLHAARSGTRSGSISGPPTSIESTYLVPAGSTINTIDEVAPGASDCAIQYDTAPRDGPRHTPTSKKCRASIR
jgi:polar amino acid transport system substrate-binding protein